MKKKTEGYQPEKVKDTEHVVPPNTGSHVQPAFRNAKYDYKTGIYTIECNGKKYMSKDGEKWEFDITDPAVAEKLREATAIDLKLPKDMLFPVDVDPWGNPVKETNTQAEIREITDAMKDLLLYKNEKYGDSAINPLGIFTKHLKTVPENTGSILVRLDDKLGRVKNAEVLRINDVADIIGYCTLLLISMGATKEDIEKFKD